MTRRLLAGYLSIAVLVLIVLEIPLGLTFADSERDRLLANLERDAATMAALVEDGLHRGEPTPFRRIARDYGRRTGARAVIVDRQGLAVADSEDVAGRDFSTRPEMVTALGGGRAVGTRRSETLDERLFFVAVPVASGGRVHGAVRLTLPTDAVDARIRRNWLTLGLVAAVVLASAAGVGLALARSLVRPVRDLEATSERMAGGDLSARVPTDQGPPDLRRLARRFNGMAEKVETLVEAQRQFASYASHQLRTPLTALRLRLENAAAGEAGDLDAAVEETDRLARVVDQLLLLARVERGSLPTETVDLAAAARERRDVWEPLCADRDVELAVEAPETLPVSAAAGTVEQVLDNLVDNALAVAPPRSCIRVTVAAAAPWGELHVADEGPGLSEEDRRRAFDPFWRGRPGGAGSGLGLPIVRQLVAASEGEVELREAPGGGIDATVRLPLTDH